MAVPLLGNFLETSYVRSCVIFQLCLLLFVTERRVDFILSEYTISSEAA